MKPTKVAFSQQDSAAETSSGLAALRAIVGAQHVSTSYEDRLAASDPYAPAEWEEQMLPLAVVHPGSTEEVQALVRAANEHGLNLWPVSRGKNNGYGGQSPRSSTSVVVHLGRMNQILEINEELAYAVVEPGVSFFDLYEALGEIDHRLWMDCPDLGWGSVLGNALEHGIGYTNYGDRASSICGMEVVLPTGEILRTGMGALPDSPTWHAAKRTYGPSVDELFMQSNLGIVTRVGVWLMPAPECYAHGIITVPEDAHLEPLVDLCRKFVLDGTLEGQPVLFPPMAAMTMMMKKKDIHPEDGPIPAEVIAAMAKAFGLGTWNVKFPMYGREAEVDLRLETLRRAVEETIPGGAVVVQKYRGLPPLNSSQSEKVHAGVPSLDMLEMLNFLGGDQPDGHMMFSPILPFTGRHAREVLDLVDKALSKLGIEYGTNFVMHGRYLTGLCLPYLPKGDVAVAERLLKALQALIVTAAEQGYAEYRTHVLLSDVVADQLDFNNHVLMRTLESIKDALDPRGILAPGRAGIWPSHLRETGIARS
ncbi:FAD-binding oxidoreductase [Nocardia sp. NPDC005366]|uniref:FAD-binding oxidoreductase n=1 Tax=Nocardia sp. NPDC005366 TaxID=3156878 RepID=UPI00339F1EAF